MQATGLRRNPISLKICLAALFFPLLLNAQNFVRITDPDNPIANDLGASGYAGCSWIDYDNDGDLDVYANRGLLYRNEGNQQFTKIADHGIGAGLQQGLGSGNSWADIDNDGDLDLFYSDRGSALYLNNGDGTFARVTQGEIGQDDANRGWSCAWGDLDNDGLVDLVITHPGGFVGPPTTNHLYHNDGGGKFSRITDSDVTTGLAPYTVGSWSDFDDDGDQDLFIGSGPAGSEAPDFLYKNQLVETGTAGLERIQSGNFATDARDGQVFNWIDYDNDGDLDAYVTNYAGNGGNGLANDLYRNEGNGSFTKIATGAIVTDSDISLGNTWADFDNDGDLDCVVANENGFPNRYYQNNGDGTFSSRSNLEIIGAASARNTAAAAGDYDDDGDLDMFMSGPGAAQALFRNDLDNGNHWLNIKLEGTIANRAAIGAKIRAKATIGGTAIWQRREVSSQNTFNGHSSLRVHFGLGDATVVDSLVIEWPGGGREVRTAVAADQFLEITEEIPAGTLITNFSADRTSGVVPLTVSFTDFSIADPNEPIVSWRWDFDNDGTTDSEEQNPTWEFDEVGRFDVRLTIASASNMADLVKEDLIEVTQFGRVTESALVSETSNSQGGSWADYDGDGDVDLFVSNSQLDNNFLYQNDGNGTFTKIVDGAIANDGGISQAASWGDYDNDGHPDLYVVNLNQANFLYKNNGDGTFTKIESGAIVEEVELSSGCSWVDFDQDGDLDMYVTNLGLPNSLYVNQGEDSFVKLTEGEIVTERAFSRSSAWADFDGDGDQDGFIANERGQDNALYVNNGDGTFTKMTSGQIGSNGGNSYAGSWGDYDNDGDLDLYVINAGNEANFLYRNDGEAGFVRLTEGAIANDEEASQGVGWADYDNDGDLDLFVANFSQASTLYENRITAGEGFVRLDSNPFMVDVLPSIGVSWADYDRDGDSDLFVATSNNSNNALYFNSEFKNNWLNIATAAGEMGSNGSAIGAKIRLKATIDGQPVWQMRELSGQTGYASQSSPQAAFGLGDAVIADSLIVEWPSGQVDLHTRVDANQFIVVREGAPLAVDSDDSERPSVFSLAQNYPNPFNPSTTIAYSLPQSSIVTLKIYNLLGAELATLIDRRQQAGVHALVWDGKDRNGRTLSSGVYLYKLEAGSFVDVKRMVLMK